VKFNSLQVGKPTEDWQNDPEGKPESAVSKVIRGTAKNVVKHGKGFIPSTGNEYLDGGISTAADVAENQLDADPHASAKDRLKMAGGDVISGVADTVDNPAVSVAANVAIVSKVSIIVGLSYIIILAIHCGILNISLCVLCYVCKLLLLRNHLLCIVSLCIFC